MSEILSTALILLILAGAFAALVAWVRRDTFTGARYQSVSEHPADATHDAESARDAQTASPLARRTEPSVRGRRVPNLG